MTVADSADICDHMCGTNLRHAVSQLSSKAI